MVPLDDAQRIHALIGTYGYVFEAAAADLLTRLFWLDDPRDAHLPQKDDDWKIIHGHFSRVPGS